MEILLQGTFNVTDCDLSRLPQTRCYCSPESADIIREATSKMDLHGIHLLGSGDFHYQTLFWLERIQEPFSLILIDNHPDDQTDAFGGELLSCGNWVLHARKLPMLHDVLWVREEKDARDAWMPEGPLYLSVDIDVLDRKYAVTNWDQGEMSLDALCRVVKAVRASGRLIGADICGGISFGQGGSRRDELLNEACYSAVLRSLKSPAAGK